MWSWKTLNECNPFEWYGKNGQLYNASLRRNNYVYNRSYELAWKRVNGRLLSKGVTVLAWGSIVGDVYLNGITAGNTMEALLLGVSLINPWCALGVFAFTAVDMGIGYYTGQSFTDRLGNYAIYKGW